MVRYTTYSEASDALRELREHREQSRLDAILKEQKAREDRAKDNMAILEARRLEEREYPLMLEAARNDALSTALKAIFITALDPHSLTENGIVTAENMVDNYVTENGGVRKILSPRVQERSYFLTRLAEIVEEVAQAEMADLANFTENQIVKQIHGNNRKPEDYPGDKSPEEIGTDKDLKAPTKVEGKNDETIAKAPFTNLVNDFKAKIKEDFQAAVSNNDMRNYQKNAAKQAEQDIKDAEAIKSAQKASTEAVRDFIEMTIMEMYDGEISDDLNDKINEFVDGYIEEYFTIDMSDPDNYLLEADDEEEGDDEEEDVDVEVDLDVEDDEEGDDSEDSSDDEEEDDTDEEDIDSDSDNNGEDDDDEDVESVDDEEEIDSDEDGNGEDDDDEDVEKADEDDEASKEVKAKADELDIKDDDDEDGDGEDDDVEDALGDDEDRLDDDEEDSDDDIDGPAESKGKIFDELEDEPDVKKAIEVIRNRIADAEETFIKKNAADKKEINTLLDRISNNIKNAEGADKDSKEAKVAEEHVTMLTRDIEAIREGRELTIFEKMTRELSKGIVKDLNLLESYQSEDGKLDQDLVMETARVMYGFLETVNTLQLEMVDEKYLQEVIESIQK